MANDVFSMEVPGTAAGEPTSCILHYERTSGTSDIMTTLSDLTNVFNADISTAWQDATAQNYSILGTKVRRVNNGGSPTMAVPTGGAPGTIAHDGVDAATGAALLFYYASDPTVKFPAGHTVAGKCFIPFAPATYITANALTAPYITALNNLINAIKGSHVQGGQTFDFVVWSKKFTKAFGPFDLVVSGKVAIQRRRLLPVL